MANKVNRKQCRTCLYRAAGGKNTYQAHNCEYILLMGHIRPSPPSPDCTAYQKFNPKERNRLERQMTG